MPADPLEAFPPVEAAGERQNDPPTSLVQPPPNILQKLSLPRLPLQKRSREKRKRLLASTLALFGQRGYEATTIEDIAAQADVSVGTFYSYFQSKCQVLLVLMGMYLDDLLVGGLEHFDLLHEPLVVIEATVSRILQPERPYTGLWRAWSEAVFLDQEIATCDRQIDAWVQASIAAAIDRARVSGRIRADLDSQATALALMALLWDLSQDAGPDPKGVIKATSRLIYHALFADSVPFLFDLPTKNQSNPS